MYNIFNMLYFILYVMVHNFYIMENVITVTFKIHKQHCIKNYWYIQAFYS